jgi:hypothetical protein
MNNSVSMELWAHGIYPFSLQLVYLLFAMTNHLPFASPLFLFDNRTATNDDDDDNNDNDCNDVSTTVLYLHTLVLFQNFQMWKTGENHWIFFRCTLLSMINFLAIVLLKPFLVQSMCTLPLILLALLTPFLHFVAHFTRLVIPFHGKSYI